ncbi:MAG: hypothetical protein NC123_12970 [Butyrivibrio sp.]|nr:hypothetical protein [Acetatifactor muris]MCM1560432.1 hypothetical protein [Butyrivibrio sp.]
MKMTGIRLFKVNLLRMVRQPLFWGAAFGIGLIRFVYTFGDPEIYRMVLTERFWQLDMLYLTLSYGWSTSLLPYINLCLAALPAVLLYIQDDRSGRMSVLLPRVGWGRYALSQAFSAAGGAFFCMLGGDVLFFLAGHFGVGLPVGSSCSAEVTCSLLEAGNYWGGLLVYEAMNGMHGAFLTLLASAVAGLVRDAQFVVILPMILQFFFTYSWAVFTLTAGLPIWLSPKFVYEFGWSPIRTDGLMLGFALGHLLLTALIVSLLLYVLIRRRYRR